MTDSARRVNRGARHEKGCPFGKALSMDTAPRKSSIASSASRRQSKKQAPEPTKARSLKRPKEDQVLPLFPFILNGRSEKVKNKSAAYLLEQTSGKHSK